MWHASIAAGRLRTFAAPAAEGEQLLRTLKELRTEAESLGGSLIIEKAPDAIKSKISAWGSLGSREELMRRIKRQLDPQRLLSPGRFAGL
jgi:glycolate oxidase FAD binding subunit